MALKRKITAVVCCCMLLGFSGCGASADTVGEVQTEAAADGPTEERKEDGTTENSVRQTGQQTGEEGAAVQVTDGLYTVDTRIEDVINDPVFGDYGRMIFPVDSYFYSGDTLGELGLTFISRRFIHLSFHGHMAQSFSHG